MSGDGAGDSFDYIFKLIVVGDSGVGKSSLTVRLSEDIFTTEYASTIAIDFRMYAMELGGKRVRLQIWDTAGQERFAAVASSFYRGANGVLLCFDVTDRASFDSMETWLARVRHHAVAGTPYLLVGCKADLSSERQVAAAEAEEWAEQRSGVGLRGYVETSALNAANVNAAFEAVVSCVMEAWDDQSRLCSQEEDGAGAASTPEVGRLRTPSDVARKRSCRC